MDNRDMTTEDFFVEETVNSLGRAVPGGDDAITRVGNDRFVN